jgi:hypothetical protein
MELPIGAAAAANATRKVINHFVLRLYSYGLSTSGITVNLPSNPRRFERGIIESGRERTEDDLDFDLWAGCSSNGAGSIVSDED